VQGALDTIVNGLQYAVAGRHNAFVWLAGAQVRLLVELGRIEEGLRHAREYLDLIRRERLTMADDALWIGYCEALVANGEFAEAVLTIDGVIEVAEQLGRAGLALGSLYETRARMAIRMSDSPAFERYAERCAQEYRRAQNPALAIKLVRLLDDAQQQTIGAPGPLAPLRDMIQVSAEESEYDTVHSRMLECVDSIDRARCALTLLLQSTESACGYLFGLRDGKPMLLAALPDVPVDPGMSHWLEDCVQSAFGSSDSMTQESSSEETRSESMLRYTDGEGRALEPVFLFGPQATERKIAAILVLHLPTHQRTLPSRRMLDDLASELMAHGDLA
jgi:hypothetical protein